MTPDPVAIQADTALSQHTLPNGLRVLTAVMPYARSATVSLFVGAGSRYESPAEAGISHLVEHLCFKGSDRWPTARAISEAIEGVGGLLNAGTDREYTVYYAKVPRAHLPLALDVVADIALRPICDPVEVEKERNVILEELAMIEDSPAQLAEVELDALLWPGQPLGRDVAGTPESVRAIPRDRALAYRYDHYTPRNALLSVAGAIDPAVVVAAAQAITADWPHGTPGAWQPAPPFDGHQPRIAVRHKPTEQANVVLGLPGVSSDDPDRFALSLLASALGDGMSSRLFVTLREELALAYDVQASSTNLLDTGALTIFLAVDPANALAALRVTLDELAHLRDGIPAPELTKIREYIKGRMLLSLEDTRAVSSWYGGQGLLLGRTRAVDEVIAELDAVTAGDLARVAHAIIREDRLHLAVVGPFQDPQPFRDALHLGA